jgi:hypothetical protein
MNPSIGMIHEAIHGRKRLFFRYLGFPRVVEPTRLGIGNKGYWQISAPQIRGRSRTGNIGHGEPKLFNVAWMQGLSLLDESFNIPALYSRGDKRFRRIDTEL